MKLRVKIELLKFCSAVFNSVFLALGLSVAGCGVWILFGQSSFLGDRSSYELWLVATALLAIGAAAAALSVVGCVGASCENRSLLMLYMAILIILVLGQLYVILLLLINRNKIERTLDDVVRQAVRRYGAGRDAQDRLVDNMQRYGRCCGVESPADWLVNWYVQSLNLSAADALDVLPCSCFQAPRAADSPWCSQQPNLSRPLLGRGNHTFPHGCQEKLSDWLKENSVTIVSMDAGLIFIQVLQFVVAIFLYRSSGVKLHPESAEALVEQPDPRLSAQHELDHGEDNYAYMEADGDDLDRDAYTVGPPDPPHPPVQNYQDYQGLRGGF